MRYNKNVDVNSTPLLLLLCFSHEGEGSVGSLRLHRECLHIQTGQVSRQELTQLPAATVPSESVPHPPPPGEATPADAVKRGSLLLTPAHPTL